MLTVSGLNVFHSNLQVVWDLSFRVNKGELVTMIGPNGAGQDYYGRDNRGDQPEGNRFDPV